MREFLNGRPNFCVNGSELNGWRCVLWTGWNGASVRAFPFGIGIVHFQLMLRIASASAFSAFFCTVRR